MRRTVPATTKSNYLKDACEAHDDSQIIVGKKEVKSETTTLIIIMIITDNKTASKLNISFLFPLNGSDKPDSFSACITFAIILII